MMCQVLSHIPFFADEKKLKFRRAVSEISIGNVHCSNVTLSTRNHCMLSLVTFLVLTTTR